MDEKPKLQLIPDSTQNQKQIGEFLKKNTG
jgi:hypothetical protein